MGRVRLTPVLEGMAVSLHTVGRGSVNFENHRKQIDFHGSGVFEIHPDSPIELATRARGLIGGLVEPKLVQEERLSS